MKPYALIIALVCFIYTHTSKSAFNNFYFDAEHIQNARAQIEQALENNSNLEVSLNTLSRLSALHEALDKQLYDLIEPLLKAGADPNKKNNPAQWAPLHYVADNQNELAYLQLLLEHNAHVNITNEEQETPLLLAALYGNYQGAQVLLEHGADPNIQDKWGNTALHEACTSHIGYQNNSNLRETMVTLLLKYKADPFIKNNNNQTALDIAQKNGFQSLVKLIRNLLL